MKCNNCKKEIDNDSKFCEFCGAKIERNIKVVKVKLKEVLFNKNSIHFWVFLLSTILLVVLFSSFTQQANLSLEDILYLQSSSHFYISNDSSKLISICIFFISLYSAFIKYKEKNINLVFLFISIGTVYNPFFPFQFDNNFQNIVEFITAILFGYFTFKEYKEIVRTQKVSKGL